MSTRTSSVARATIGSFSAVARTVLVAALFAAVASPVFAAPAPGSLRVAKVAPASIRLTWGSGGPTAIYGVYASPDADDVVRPAWLIAGTRDLSYTEPIAADAGRIRYYFVADPIPCTTATDCDDHRPCTGVEFCNLVERRCRKGAAVNCNDGNDCTQDACNDQTGGCTYTTVGCDDGNACTIDLCRAEGGCYSRVDPDAGAGLPAELAARPLASYPYADYAPAFNSGSAVSVAVDPTVYASVVGKTCDVYVVAKRSAAQWCAGGPLVDVRGAPDTRAFVAGGVRDDTFTLTGSTSLSADAGTAIGKGYDLALDCNRNGLLDAGELADGLADDPGFAVVHDITQAGPLAVSQFDDLGPEPPHCSGSGLDDMRIYHPSQLSDPGFTGKFPLVVISHGNGHCFDWYDFLGRHLASYGFIVMSHDNDTVPGIETASTTTLTFTDKILLNQASIGGGVLNGHIDSTRIAWIGHSRGGEGVARAYDRLVDEGYATQRYTAKDIKVISSIAPTDFLGPSQSNPHGVPYHLLYGSSDGDVCGCPNNSVAQSYGVYERATGARQVTYVHGADHNDFNCCGFDDFSGPAGTAIGRPEAQQVQKAVQLALIEYYIAGSTPARDFLWRQWETFRPQGVAADTVVVNELREGPSRRTIVIDDFQAQPSLASSSSGGVVSSSVASLVEDREREVDGNFEWTGSEPMNGMTRGRDTDIGRGAVFEFPTGGTRFYEFGVIPAARDFTDDTFLSFRAAQMTRHPLTTAALADLTFTVTLVDGAGNRSSINIGAYGGGIEEPYQRTGYGTGAGWQNEFETIRIRVRDFTRDGAAIDLGNIQAVRFEFGGSFGSSQGRVSIDDVELERE